MNNSQYPLARTNGLVVQEVPNEVLVFDTETNEAHCLNETAAMVWKYCDGKTSVPEIAGILGENKGSSVSDDLVWLAIDQLNEHKLLEQEIASKFVGQSRREVLKKIGLAAVVALPIVASMAAPRSVLANVSCVCDPINNGPPNSPPNQNFECLAGPCQPWCGGGGTCVPAPPPFA